MLVDRSLCTECKYGVYALCMLSVGKVYANNVASN
jgi:hypothetical protein